MSPPFQQQKVPFVTSTATTPSYDFTNTDNLVAKSWTSAAIGYNELFVPRFQPWTNDCLKILREEFPSFVKGKEQQEQNCNCNDESSSPLLATVFVPCCGPGQELIPVSEIVAPYPVIGMDIAPGMIQIARERIKSHANTANEMINVKGTTGSSDSRTDDKDTTSITASTIAANQDDKNDRCGHLQSSNIEAYVGDCCGPDVNPNTTITKQQSQKYCVVFSIFGLQQMVDPLTTLKYWISNLISPGGIAIICFWPPGGKVETDSHALWGPKLRQLLQKHSGNGVSGGEENKKIEKDSNGDDSTTLSSSSSTAHQQSACAEDRSSSNNNNSNSHWDDDIAKVVDDAGADIVHDFEQAHEIKWDNPNHFWNAMTKSGPWHKLRFTKGDDYVDGILKDEFYSSIFATNGEGSKKNNHGNSTNNGQKQHDNSSSGTPVEQQMVLSHSPCARIIALRKR